MAILGTDGNIMGKGWISMGSDSLNGPWSAVFGQNCSGNGTGSAVSGGISNRTIGDASAIGGGQDNYVGGDFSAIPGGYADTIANGVEYSYLFGIDSDLSHDSTFMVDMPHIRFGDETDGYEFPADDGSSGQVMTTDGSGQLGWANASGSDADWTISGDNMYSAVTGNVGIGISSPTVKLHVYNISEGIEAYLGSSYSAVYGRNNIANCTGYFGTDNGIGVSGFGSNTGVLGWGTNYGVFGENDSLGNYGYLGGNTGYGVYGNGAVGVYGRGPNSGNFGYLGSGSYGVYGRADSGYAGYFYGEAMVTQNFYALGDVGIGTSIPEEQLQVDGRVFIKGNTVDEGLTIGNAQTGSNSVHLSWQSNIGLSIHSWDRAFGDQLFIDGNSANVGIGTSDPDQSLHIVGNIKIDDGSQGEGYFLVSDSVGVGRWEYWGFPSESEIGELYDIIEKQNSRIARLEKEIADIKSNQR
jgi:hypothetical protein